MSDGVIAAPSPAPVPSLRVDVSEGSLSEPSPSPIEAGSQKSFAARVTEGFFENLRKVTEIGELFESNEEGEEEEKKEQVIVRRVIEEEKFPLDDPDKFIEDTVEKGVEVAFQVVFGLFGLKI